MTPRLLLLLPLALAACAPQEATAPRADANGNLLAWSPGLPPDHSPVLREDLPPPADADPASAPLLPSQPSDAPADDLPTPPPPPPGPHGGQAAGDAEALPLPPPPAPAEDAETPTDAASAPAWTEVARIPGVPERRAASRPARDEIGADCAGHLPPAAIPFATPWIDLRDGRVAVAADGQGAPMIYLRNPDGDWHCGLLRAEGPARPGRWQIHVGALLEGAPVPPARLRIEHAGP